MNKRMQSTVIAVIAGSAALLALPAAGSPIHSHSNPFFPGHGRYETRAEFSAPGVSGFYGHHSLGKTLSRRWNAAQSLHSLKPVDLLARFRARSANLAGPFPVLGGAGHGVFGFGGFDREDPFHCEPEAGPVPSNPPAAPAAVPEPGTWILFALGIAVMLGFRGVRKTRAP